MDTEALKAEAKHLRLKKRFSQNFLIDAGTIDKIVEALNLSSDETLVEIGAGSGFLTQALIGKTKRLIALEVENKMVAYLTEKFALDKPEPPFELIHQDVMRVDFKTLVEGAMKVVGNLPYAITSPILFKLCGELHEHPYPLREKITSMTFMVQKEVGQRISARPGTKPYNALSVCLQFWFETKMICNVPSRAFMPAPKVDSAVIQLKPRNKAFYDVRDHNTFSKLVKGAFAYRRKTLKNALQFSHFADAATIDKIIEIAGSVPTDARAQELSIEQLGQLANAYTELTG